MKDDIIYKINSAEWDDEEHSFLLLNVSQIKDGVEIDNFFYTSRLGDNLDPLNQILWDLAMSDKTKLKESERLQMITGKIPPLPGYRLLDGRLVHEEEEKIMARQTINAKLDWLYSGSVLARAEKNPVFEKNRQVMIDALLELENSPDFPFDTVWPEEIE